MKILIIGSDRLLFKEGSAVEKRIKTYASFLERLDIIVFTGRGYAPQNLSSSVLFTRLTVFAVFFLYLGPFV
jgi:hypothetical protein